MLLENTSPHSIIHIIFPACFYICMVYGISPALTADQKQACARLPEYIHRKSNKPSRVYAQATDACYMAESSPAMIPAIWPAALVGTGFCISLLGPAAAPSVDGVAAGLGALRASDGSCLASKHFTALHLWTRQELHVLLLVLDRAVRRRCRWHESHSIHSIAKSVDVQEAHATH